MMKDRRFSPVSPVVARGEVRYAAASAFHRVNASGAAAVAVAALISAGLLLGGCSSKKPQMQQPPVPVVVADVVAKTVPFEIATIGTGEAYNSVAIRPQVGGVVKRVFFTDGQQIRKGDPLFLIDPAPYKAALDAAEAKLAGDRATVANLEESVKRYDDLAKKDYITPQEYSDMLTNLATTNAAVRADEAEVDAQKLNLEYCSISAPISGRIGMRLVDPGNVVKANPDNPLVLINQIQPMYVQFTVPQSHLPDLLKYSASDTLEVRAYAPGEDPGKHRGRLTFIDNAVDQTTGTVSLRAEFPNEDMLLWPGEFLNVILVLKRIENAVVTPSQAISTGQAGDFVFVVKPDATVEMRPVKVSYRLSNDAVIESGVAVGEKVVTDGQLRLRPGSKIVERPPVTSGDSSSS
jgi:multidrug efflux system membrane fusion protein